MAVVVGCHGQLEAILGHLPRGRAGDACVVDLRGEGQVRGGRRVDELRKKDYEVEN